MTLQEFKALLLTIDSKATHHQGPGSGNYTVWSEYQENYIFEDDKIAIKQIHIQVDRYTKLEYDPMADTITNGLDTEGVFYTTSARYTRRQAAISTMSGM